MSFWHDPQNNILLYDVPDAVRILPHLDGAQTLHNGYMAVPVSLRNCQVLRHFKLPVIPIIDQDYDWPIRAPFRPREHQKIMANFMVTHPRSLNLSDMGTMKTLATLWAADYVMLQNPGMRAVISAPISILQRVWGDAITQHFLGKRTYTILHGDHKRRRKCLGTDSDFYIMGHDALKQGASLNNRRAVQLSGLSKDIADRADIGIGIIDEASAFRDEQSMRSRVARTNIGVKPYFWSLTGTPTPNGPLDAHGLARLVNNAGGESYDHYKKRVMYHLSQWTWVPRPGAHEEAYKLLQPSIRYEMRECTDVPPCTEQMRDVELSEQQKKLIKDLKRDLQIQINSGTVTAVNEAALRLKLIQISCGAVYDTDHKATRLDCKPRLAELRAVIEEAHRKVIIFTPLTSVVHLLYDDLTEYSRAMINGEVPTKVRDEIFRRFQQDTDPQILIADPATMSHGLDLFAASVVVWYGATDRTELYLQANRRIDRPGQIVPTTVVQLAATSVEREIFKRCASNTSMQGAILQLVREQ